MRGYNSYKSGDFFIMCISTILINTLTIGITNTFKFQIISKIIFILLMVYNIYKIYYILQYCTLKYYLEEDEFIIKYFGGIIKYKIKIDDVLGYFDRNIPYGYKKKFGYELRNIMLGTFTHQILQLCKSYVTNKSNMIYISTKNGYILISPEEVEEFKYRLNRLYKPEIYLNYYEFEN